MTTNIMKHPSRKLKQAVVVQEDGEFEQNDAKDLGERAHPNPTERRWPTSKRFNSLVPHTDLLHLKVDCVISSDSPHHHHDDSDSNLLLVVFLKSTIKSL